MKGFLELCMFVCVAAAWAATEYASRHSQNIAFTFGFSLIVTGCAFIHISLAFLVPGVLICGLLTLGRLLAMRRPPARTEAPDA